MPIKQSAYKELGKSKKRHIRNINIISELKTLNKKFLDFLAENKIEEAKNTLLQLTSKLDKAAAKKIIHRGNASRKKSRLMLRLTKKSTEAGSPKIEA
ncbi:MAG: 30S ribosomal protein S20 [Candidatus Omnitrophota bacterium]